MGALLKLLATIGQNWLFWSLMDLFLEEAGVWNWREDFGTRPLVEGGLEVYSCDDDAAFLVVDRRDDNTAWMRSGRARQETGRMRQPQRPVHSDQPTSAGQRGACHRPTGSDVGHRDCTVSPGSLSGRH